MLALTIDMASSLRMMEANFIIRAIDETYLSLIVADDVNAVHGHSINQYKSIVASIRYH